MQTIGLITFNLYYFGLEIYWQQISPQTCRYFGSQGPGWTSRDTKLIVNLSPVDFSLLLLELKRRVKARRSEEKSSSLLVVSLKKIPTGRLFGLICQSNDLDVVLVKKLTLGFSYERHLDNEH